MMKTSPNHLLHFLPTWLRWLSTIMAAMVLLAACGGNSPLKQAEPTADADVSLPLKLLPSGHAALELSMSGQTGTFILDTGAGLEAVTQDWAQRLNLPPLPTNISAMGSGGSFNTQAVSLPDFSMANYTVTQAWAMVIPTSNIITFDGLIGANFLKDYVVSMDWEAKSVRFQSQDRFVPPADAQAIAFELRGRFHQIAVPVTIAGRTGWCQVDTGAHNAVSVFRPSVEAFGWRDAFSPKVRTVTGFGAGGSGDGRQYGDIVRLPSVQIGSFSLEKVVADLSLAQEGLFSTDLFMCNLGLEIWRRFSMTINYATKTLYLRPNAAYSQIFDFQRSGLFLRPEGGRLLVLEAMPGSAADLAGIQRDEWITGINQRPASEWSSAELRTLWLSPAGTLITLTVQGSSTSSTVRSLFIALKDLL
jgi:predicted aspartyl protease